jgi:hypothetical protein
MAAVGDENADHRATPLSLRLSAARHQRRAARHSCGLHSGSPGSADVGLMIDKLTATRSAITPSTKIITHDLTPEVNHGGPSQTLRMDLRIRRLIA